MDRQGLPNTAGNICDSEYSPINDENKMVRQPRIERGTYGLEGRCSIQLSYWRDGRAPAERQWSAGGVLGRWRD